MGFPRIVSKTNKIYTKLGEFCLSADGNNFWIVCHTCQEELETQDQFWKHIQDEHNFMHGLTKEHKQGQGYSTDGGGNGNNSGAGTSMLPLPLYRKMNDDEQHDDVSGAGASHEDNKGTKDYTEMRGIDMDIKLEPHSMSQSAMPQSSGALNTTTTTAALGTMGSGGGGVSGGGGHVDVSAASTLYQVPSAYAAALVHQHVTLTPALSMAAAAAVSGASGGSGVGLGSVSGGIGGGTGNSGGVGGVGAIGGIGGGGVGGNGNVGVSVVPTPLSLPQELPKDSNSTTASAGSAAVSSDDGERWYICDYDSCGLKFKYQSRLELHRSVHSKERRFACDLCGASFKQSCNLSTHRKKKHFLKGSKSLPSTPMVQQRF